MKNTKKIVALAVASAFLLSACGGGAEQDTSVKVTANTIDELYSAAKDEGKITVYGLNRP